MNIRFPSLQEISQKSVKALSRFPFVLITALIGVVSTISIIELSQNEVFEAYYLVKISFVAALGISLFIATTVYVESENWPRGKRLSLDVIVVVGLVVYYFLLPDKFIERESEALYRYFLFFLVSHLLVSVAPFLRKNDEDLFWAYNKTLFLRILTAGFYSFVLFVGLAIALLSIENLLDIDLDNVIYAELFVTVVGIFNTWFFLSVVPNPNNISKQERAYPGGLKVFVQNILIPLITVYITILYLYTGKIIIDWQWPNGWVANLVLVFSIAGILALLLLHPIRNKSENRWILLFSKGYYIGLIPLIILLMLSIWVRISEYGVTVNRYFVATLAVWLTGIVLYNLFSSSRKIKVIPASLGVIAILISFGPLGAFEVTERSQFGRFEQLLEQNEMLTEDNMVVASSEEVSFDDRKQMSSIILYMLELKGEESLQPYFDEDLTEVLEQDSTDRLTNEVRLITDLLGFEYVSEYQSAESFDIQQTSYTATLESGSVIPVGDYSYYLGDYSYPAFSFEKAKRVGVDGDSVQVRFDSEENRVEVLIGESEEMPSISVDTLISKLKKMNENVKLNTIQLKPEDMTMVTENSNYQLMVVFRNLNWREEEGKTTLSNVRFSVFMEKKE